MMMTSKSRQQAAGSRQLKTVLGYLLPAACCLLPAISGCGSATPPPSVSGPKSGDGWEIRYTAALSLVRRGSDKLKDPVVQDLVLEMLDEQQQLRNSRRTVKDREVTDLAMASETVFYALDALAEFHRQDRAFDLVPFKPAMDKLAESTNATIAKKAKAVREELGR
jgi:hypothetical protein